MHCAAWVWVLTIGISFLATVVAADDVPKAAEAPDAARFAERLEEAGKAIRDRPQDVEAYRRRAALYAAAQQHALAIADLDISLALDPSMAQAYDERGSQHFMLGHVRESIEDFDHYVKLRPDQEPWHWKRGISYYYAGRYDEGQKQFEGYQTVDDNDVENAVWRYLCMARSQGAAVAREAMLSIKRDARVPMMEVYALYSGKAQPEDVLAAARAGSPSAEAKNERLFYAHLYLGLFYEAAGDRARAGEHLTIAAERHKIGHYMWNVADVHRKLLVQAAEK